MLPAAAVNPELQVSAPLAPRTHAIWDIAACSTGVQTEWATGEGSLHDSTPEVVPGARALLAHPMLHDYKQVRDTVHPPREWAAGVQPLLFG